MKTLSFCLLSCLLIGTFAKPPVVIEPKNPNDPPQLPKGSIKKVLVIGGGLAGLSAALELADRGYLVTIKEKSQTGVGGKLFCHPVQVFPDKQFYVEHGFHAWFHNYYQFKDIRNRLNINSNFRNWAKVNFIFKEYKPEVIYSQGPYPLNLLGIIERSPNLKLTDALLSTLSLPDLIFFDYDHMFEKYDNITFHQWAQEKKVSKPFYDIIMQPALSVTLNERDIFSAAEMLTFMQIYFLTNSESDNREVPTVNYYQAVLKPWTDYLEKHNVKIILNTTVSSLKIDPKTNNVYGSVDDNVADDTVYDAVIITADVGSVQSIFNKTYEKYKSYPKIKESLEKCNNNSIAQMKIAPDYKVIRIWFDKQLNSSAPDILETPDFSPINLVAQYHLLEQEFVDWAKQTGGSVVEFHCYTWSKFFDPNVSDDKVWALISPTVKLIYPEIFTRQFNVLAYHVNSYKNFASFELGLAKVRPNTQTLANSNLNNVYLAGDWIMTPFPSALMERAVSTGRLAANEVLIRDHVRQASLTVVNSKGPGI